ncbi:MAG TPA: sterol desaturase family protein [Gemmatimonadales bacterium]|jgi:sterol desaturase/sphingolipid hydroxylase (fatty acid hydroxylase superfamily)|nr:sterol desaturase family protein [Gemmatimonadales bacterium]
MDIITLSIPFFFALIGLELLVARVRKRPLYRLSDSISDVSCGILSQFAGILIALLTIAGYGWVQQHWAVQQFLPVPAWSHSALAWVTVFLLDDLAYYWMHRSSHVVNLLWAGHVVHHSSEEFNLTVALRQSSLHGLMSWLFYLPIALLGVPVTMWLICHALNLVYQFWIHTREVDKLGPLEWILNTPSHHRVHHGINPEYQDKNFAGTLIIWDRLFGSFEPERAPAVYGITKPLATWNPVRANLHHFGEIFRNARASHSWGDRLRAVFAHPRWRPPQFGPPLEPQPVSVESFEKYEPPVPPELKGYALVQFLVVLAGSLALLGAVNSLPAAEVLAGGFYIAVSLGNIGGVLEARSWAGVSEAVRLVVLGGVAALLLATGAAPEWLLVPLLLFALGSLGWILRLRGLLTSSDVRAVVVM